MQLDVTVDLLTKAKTSLTNYRRIGFTSAQVSAKDMCEEMNVEAVLKEKRLRSTKRHFAYEVADEPIADAMKRLEITFFNLLTFIHKKHFEELYPNLWVALRIACTLPVTVASAERSFSELKLIKTYLRSSMGQERLSGLAIISINHEVGKDMLYKDIIDDFEGP
ncbi:uncharacterized protein LOC143027403 [Oratosquilla oratoria]|uniref:uncharacterized protein LOC143027403 n=1 Tax=Oratosquilla oratoria TaxID=337810 RepID=UPI003F772B10